VLNLQSVVAPLVLVRQDGASLGRETVINGVPRGPIYVSAKRTQFIFAILPMYHIYLQKLRAIMRSFLNWVRFPKRTQFEGVYEGVSVENGLGSGERKPLDAAAMWCAVVGMTDVLWLEEGVLMSWETLRFAQSDKSERGRG
jgi:hypothetical protein